MIASETRQDLLIGRPWHRGNFVAIPDFQSVMLPLIETLVTASNRNLPPIVQRNLAPLRSFVVYGTGKTGLSKFTAFLQIK